MIAMIAILVLTIISAIAGSALRWITPEEEAREKRLEKREKEQQRGYDRWNK